MTSSIWTNPPPILKPNPKSQRTSKITMIVQSMYSMPDHVGFSYTRVRGLSAVNQMTNFSNDTSGNAGRLFAEVLGALDVFQTIAARENSMRAREAN